MLRYKLYQSKRENSPMNGKWYAHVQLSETLTLEDLAKHIGKTYKITPIQILFVSLQQKTIKI